VVDVPTVVEVGDVGGSTSEARWMPVKEVTELHPDKLTEVTAEALRAARLT
jgi:hypothetical protein